MFILEENTSVIFVRKILPRKEVWGDILKMFMMEPSHSNAMFVTKGFPERLI